MKKVVRTVWISLLSGLAFLVACTSPKGLSRAEKKQLKAERADLINRINQQSSFNSNDPKIMYEIKQDEMGLLQRLNEIDLQLGDEKSIAENNSKIDIVSSEIDSLRNVIKSTTEPEPCVYGPPIIDEPTSIPEEIQLKEDLTRRLMEIQGILKRRESACVYGSPEVIEKYRQQTELLKIEAKEIEKQLEELDNE